MNFDASSKKQKTFDELDDFEPVLVKRRWLMLMIFASVSMLNSFQWLHINIVTSSAIYFWNASLPGDAQGKNIAVAWLSMIYMLVYIPVIFPATWLLNHYGLRVAVLIGAGMNALGALLKCLSMELSQPINSSPSSSELASFPILMIAQFVCAVGQVFILGVPPQVASTWFGKSEIAMATAIGVFGNQVGCALSFGLTPLMVPAPTEIAGLDQFENLKRGFRILLYGGAAIIFVDLTVVAIFFKDQPEIAPSLVQYKRILQRRSQRVAGKHGIDSFDATSDFEGSVLTEEELNLVNQGYFKQIAYCFRSVSFVLLNICYGVNTGVYCEIGTLLSSVVSEYFPAEFVDIGWSGFSMVISGLVGSIVAGIVLKKTGLYRRVVIIFYFLSVISMGAFTASMYSKTLGTVFFTIILLGFFQAGFLPLGFEYAAEITYPVNEGLTSGILNTSAHIFGVILTQIASWMIGPYGSLSTNLLMVVSMAVAAVPACFMKDDLKRQRAHQKETTENDFNYDDLGSPDAKEVEDVTFRDP